MFNLKREILILFGTSFAKVECLPAIAHIDIAPSMVRVHIIRSVGARVVVHEFLLRATPVHYLVPVAAAVAMIIH